ncbi:hypothetical protein CYY_004169 [Polysphondylium violaceum]|uniref:DUF6748 domain-containing protein n=1 Tax=Polysphondylium violaceum TaxID=133409 RepID=A0A8J4PVN5_9MYCE|nr:hypothetical protein CYY_004169 [Polysphondylium violaceum]
MFKTHILLLFLSFFILGSLCQDREYLGKFNDKRRNTYYTARKDLRRCAFPDCGGYFLKKLNPVSKSDKNEIYVANIENTLYVDTDALDQYIFSGFIRTDNPRMDVLNIMESTRMLPLNYTIDAPITYYILLANEGSSFKALELNTGVALSLKNYTQQYTRIVYRLNEPWFKKSLVGMSVVSGNVKDQVLNIDKVFYRNVPKYQCPSETLKCSKNQTLAYTYDENRCKIQDQCVKPGPCLLSMALCTPGYSLVSIPSAPNGCPKYYCDPTFLTKR